MEAAAKEAGTVMNLLPKDGAGKPVTDFTKGVVTVQGREYKAWESLADFLRTQDAQKLQEAYGELSPRKADHTGFNPYHLLRSPNKFTALRWVVVLTPIALLAALFLFLRYRRNKRRGYSRSMFGKAGRAPRRGKPAFTPNRRMRWNRRRSSRRNGVQDRINEFRVRRRRRRR